MQCHTTIDRYAYSNTYTAARTNLCLFVHMCLSSAPELPPEASLELLTERFSDAIVRV